MVCDFLGLPHEPAKESLMPRSSAMPVHLAAETMPDGFVRSWSENACKKKKTTVLMGDVLLIREINGILRSKMPLYIYVGLPYQTICKARPRFALQLLPSMYGLQNWLFEQQP